MKYIRRMKKSPPDPGPSGSPSPSAAGSAQTPASGTASDQGKSEATKTPEPAASSPQDSAATPRSSQSMPNSKKGLEKELAALREEHDRLARTKQQEDAQRVSEKLESQKKVHSLESQVEDLKTQLAQRAREDGSDDNAGGSEVQCPCFDQPAKSTAYVPLNARSGRTPGTGVPRKIVLGAGALVGVETALLLGFACAYFTEMGGGRPRPPPPAPSKPGGGGDGELHESVERVPELQEDLRKSMDQEKYWESRFKKDAKYWETRVAKVQAEANLSDRPYEQITGLQAHQVPEMYGKVREKTIWAYWYHKDDCRTASDCTLPPVVQLCSETIERNKGGFDFKIVHMDEVEKYVNKMELPMRWNELIPAHQKDSLMNALLARYGGVAMDISTILLRPIDDYWEEMVSRGATFMGYMYRLNGMPWRHAETTSVWFLMSRREGIFSTAVRNQVIGMGDRRETGAYHHWYLALGDQTITPILHMFNYSLPTCMADETIVRPPRAPQWDQKASMCPEHEVRWSEDTSAQRNDTKVILRDPRNGPQMPFAFGAGMALWSISDSTAFSQAQLPSDQRSPGAPMQGESCSSPKACWEVFMKRYEQPAEPGRGRLLNFVKLFAHAKELKGLSRQQILSHTDAFFVHWLHLAGV